MINNLVRVNLLARAYFNIDKRSLPEAILNDRSLSVFYNQLVSSRMKNKLFTYTINKP